LPLEGDQPIDFRDSFRNARCLVTGGAGFIGSNLVRHLLDAAARVTVVDNFSTGRREHLPAHPQLVVVEDDLCRSTGLARYVADADYVFHLAAQVGNIKSIASPVADADTNILATVRLLDACRGASIRRLVYSSSSAIFGEAERLPIDEEHSLQPRSFYAVSKLTGERYVRLAADLLAVPTVCLRYFNVYGLPMEMNDYTGVISIFLRRLEAGDTLTIYGDGEQLRDFIYVDDVVQANLRAAASGPPGGIYNIGTGVGTTVRELAAVLMTLTGRHVAVEHADFRAGEVRRSLADPGRARRELGFEPQFDIRRGLARMLGVEL